MSASQLALRPPRAEYKSVNPSAEDAERGIITLPLHDKAETLFSSSDYSDYVVSVLSPMDTLVTWGPRYTGVVQSIFSNSFQIGQLIEYTATNPPAALLFYLMMGIATAASVKSVYQQKEAAAEAKRSTHTKLMTSLTPQPELVLSDEDYTKHLHQKIDKINSSYKRVLAQNSTSFKEIKIVISDEAAPESKSTRIPQFQIRYTFKPASEDDSDLGPEKPGLIRKFFNKVTEPLYSGLGLASFTYWILLMISAISVGTFAAAGIAGLSPFLAFGIPLAAMTPFFGIKAYNYFKNRNGVSDEQARLVKVIYKEAPNINAKVLEELNYQNEVDRLSKANETLAHEVNEEFKLGLPSIPRTGMPKSTDLGIDNRGKALAAGFTTTMAQVGLTQYVAWIANDFLKVAVGLVVTGAVITPVIGGILVAIGVALGAKEGYEKYRAAQKQLAEEAKHPSSKFEPLPDIFKQRLDTLDSLAKQRNEICGSFIKPPKISQLLNKLITPPAPISILGARNFVDWSATGIFFGRLFFTAGTAIFLPFAPLICAPPIAVGLLAVCGLAFLGAKYYQAKQDQKEAQAKEYVEKIKSMDEQIKVAQLTNQNLRLELRKQQLTDTLQASSANSSLVPVVSSPQVTLHKDAAKKASPIASPPHTPPPPVEAGGSLRLAFV